MQVAVKHDFLESNECIQIHIFIGGRGHVYTLDKLTGSKIWEVELKKGFFKMGNDVVSLMESSDCVYAFSYGTLFRMKKENGEIEWQTYIRDLKHSVGLLAVDRFTNSLDVMI